MFFQGIRTYTVREKACLQVTDMAQDMPIRSMLVWTATAVLPSTLPHLLRLFSDEEKMRWMMDASSVGPA